MTPDDRPTINALREIIAGLRQRVEDAEPQIEPMRATIQRYKAEIADKTAEIDALRIEVERLEGRVKSLQQSHNDRVDELWQKYNLPPEEKPWKLRSL